MSRLISTCFTNTLNPPPGPKPPPPAVECLLHVLAAAPPRRGARSFRGGRGAVHGGRAELPRGAVEGRGERVHLGRFNGVWGGGCEEIRRDLDGVAIHPISNIDSSRWCHSNPLCNQLCMRCPLLGCAQQYQQ